MSDKLYRISIERLINWIESDYRENKIFGIYKQNLFDPQNKAFLSMERFGQHLETPLGVAAGPHTQMAHNIIASWLVGARFIELKTIQTLDELEVSKPCIDMEDEGYNCEWSQELKIKDAFDEYLNAWILIHVLKDKLGWNDNEQGFIFNLSIGYDLEGILKPNVQWFLDKMNNCKEEKEKKLDILLKVYPRIKNLNIPDKISNNVTLSTMHGCPSDEIERIGQYLIEERNLHTSIKLNPTLLGKERLRFILNDKLGYKLEIPDTAFEHDLKYPDAVNMIKNLSNLSKARNLEFSVKLTNTLESVNRSKWLPKKEEMVYTSGRALHPISINLAEKLQSEFKGELDISFSAGIDAFNVSDTLACNLKPITVCSDLLKPGGYLRLVQYLEQLDKNFQTFEVNSIEEFVTKISGKDSPTPGGLANLRKYSIAVLEQQRYWKSAFPYDNIKTQRTLTPFDCIHAPCIEDCAVSQNVPEYMYHTANKRYLDAFKVILRDNPLPNITGNVCDHLCQPKCTRINYDNPLLIRGIKRFNAEKFDGQLNLANKEKNGFTAAVLGAGPSGLSCAYFLAMNGFTVELYESKPFAGGMVSDSIPHFRLTDGQIEADIRIIRSLGVKFHFNKPVTKTLFKELQNNFDFIYIGIGAQNAKKLNIPGEEIENVHDQLSFLSKIRREEKISIGPQVAVIGGGNSAIDAARTSKRIVGNEGSVVVVYRRKIQQMPADPEEIRALLEEGISIIELASPTNIIETNDRLKIVCQKMELGDMDTSGRRKPIPVDGSEFSIEIDSVITAIGQDTVLDFLDDKSLKFKENGETQFDNIFAGGDATRGADSLINAIADGKNAAEVISFRANNKFNIINSGEGNKLTLHEYQKKQAYRIYGKRMPELNVNSRINFDLVHPNLSEVDAVSEAERCLYCNDVCNICVGVCPNFANVSFESEKISIPVYSIDSEDLNKIELFDSFKIDQGIQIFNIGDFCNECGNCTTFCPTAGDPYLIKPKFYLTESSFDNEDNCYYLCDNKIKYKKNGRMDEIELIEDQYHYSNDFVNIHIKPTNYQIMKIEFKKDRRQITLNKMSEMIYLFENLRSNSIFA